MAASRQLEIDPYEERPSNVFPGFVERLSAWLPELQAHTCSVGQPGGFIERLVIIADSVENALEHLEHLAASVAEPDGPKILGEVAARLGKGRRCSSACTSSTGATRRSLAPRPTRRQCSSRGGRLLRPGGAAAGDHGQGGTARRDNVMTPPGWPRASRGD